MNNESLYSRRDKLYLINKDIFIPYILGKSRKNIVVVMIKYQQSELSSFEQEDNYQNLSIFEKIKIEDILFKIPKNSK